MEMGKILHFIIVLVMVVGFLAQMWEVFGQFLSGLKTVAVSFEERKMMDFPIFAFCDSRGFRSRTSNIANAAQYNATTFNLEEEVKLTTIGYETDDWENTYTSQLVPTMLNGYCMLYEFYREYPIGTFVVFHMPANRSYDVFLLERGTMLSLISQSLIQPQPTFTVTHDTQIFLSKTINKISEENCHKITNSERMDCVIENIQKNISATGISCLPFQYSSVFPKLYSKFPPCINDSVLASTIHAEMWSIIDTQMKEGCHILCENVEYHLRLSKMGQNFITDNKNTTVLFAKYSTPKIKIEEEYTLMGVNAIISATGGSLGLFLGLSCYGVVWKLVKMLEGACHSNQSKNMVVLKDKPTIEV